MPGAVILHHGPYEAHGFLKHRSQKLHGLLKILTKKGYEVEIRPAMHLNRLTVEIQGTVVFQCDIRNLLFNMDYEDDVVCQRVVDAIDEAADRIFSSNNVAKFPTIQILNKLNLMKKEDISTKDYFSSSTYLLFEQKQREYDDLMAAISAEKKTQKRIVFRRNRSGTLTAKYSGVYDSESAKDIAANVINTILTIVTGSEEILKSEEYFSFSEEF